MIPKEEPYFSAYDDMPALNQIEEYETHLASEPFNLNLRVNLMSRYSGSRFSFPQYNAALARHVLWFIEQVPDWKFCGSYDFAIEKNAVGFTDVKELWEQKIQESENLMRRVNYYLFFFNNERTFIPELYDRLFQGRENDIWIRALRQAAQPEQTIYSDLIEAERRKPLATARQMKKFELINDEEFICRVVGNSHSITNYEKLKNTFETRTTEKKLVQLLGYIWNRNSHFSVLNFDPEILCTYIKLSAWFVRNMPAMSRNLMYFAFYPFLVGPEFGDGIDIRPAVGLLTDLWLEQVDSNPDNLRIARNAVMLCRRIHMICPDDHKRIMKHVGKTAVGKRALRLEKY